MAGTYPKIENTGGIVVPKASSKGIQVDNAIPTFPWRDITGDVSIRGIGGSDPAWSTYRGNIRQMQFGAGEEVMIVFHMPHDWAVGTDLYIHAHWSHIATTVTGGSVTWGFEASFGKGLNGSGGSAFGAPVTATVSGNASTTQYFHIITEVQLSAGTPSAAQLDTDDLEVDGLILVRAYLSANNITVSSGLAPEPFLHTVDLHYQSTNVGTKNKAPSFYA